MGGRFTSRKLTFEACLGPEEEEVAPIPARIFNVHAEALAGFGHGHLPLKAASLNTPPAVGTTSRA